ncbi:hypothetical protein K1T71_012981 [Dendrolimus kikuchii]|uniref:Uncharacterized protein n=1 Tax=Dendrolimus kikuchii TaxID=765133 RepID=A0ACC1CIQ3_9NEOP|nr:hypothetical protein K1T71_012981 [Dendrolimus kikuchii]
MSVIGPRVVRCILPITQALCVSILFRYIGVVAICALAAVLVSAQITFSRDWSGGKRSAPQVSLDCTQFTKLCRHFVRELKQAFTSEMTEKHHKNDIDKLLYDDE